MTIEKKNHGKRAKFDGEIAATELDPDMAGRYRDPVTDSYTIIYFYVHIFCSNRNFSTASANPSGSASTAYTIYGQPQSTERIRSIVACQSH
jgi:hypothetical protein